MITLFPGKTRPATVSDCDVGFGTTVQDVMFLAVITFSISPALGCVMPLPGKMYQTVMLRQ